MKKTPTKPTKTTPKAQPKPPKRQKAKRATKTAKAKTTAQAKPADPEPARKTKGERLKDLLRRPGGANSSQIERELGWLPHSIRSAISQIEGVTKTKDKTRGTVYSMA